MQCYPPKQGYSSSEAKYSMSSSQHSSSHGGSPHGMMGGGMYHGQNQYGSSAAMGGGMHHGHKYYGSSAAMGGMHHGQHQQQHYGSSGAHASMGGMEMESMHHGQHQQQHYGSSAAHASMGGMEMESMHHGQHQQQHYGSSAAHASMGSMEMDSMHHDGSRGLMGGAGGMKIHKSSSYQSSSHHQMLTVFGNDPFCEISPSSFPPGTDPKVVQCFNKIDRDGNGVIDDRELQSVLSSCSQPFSLRTVHLLMYEFTHSNKRMIGPREFVPVLKCLQTWKTMFQRFDRNRDGTIDSMELGTALNSLGYCVSPIIVNLLIAKFTKGYGGRCSLKYDQFIECCLTVKGLTETFKAREECGRASFTYEEFLLNVLPFIVA